MRLPIRLTFAPAIVGDIRHPKMTDNVLHRLTLPDQHIRFAQLTDDLLGPRNAYEPQLSPEQPISITKTWLQFRGLGQGQMTCSGGPQITESPTKSRNGGHVPGSIRRAAERAD